MVVQLTLDEQSAAAAAVTCDGRLQPATDPTKRPKPAKPLLDADVEPGIIGLVYLCIRGNIYAMSKLTRHAEIRNLISDDEIASQDELRRKLFRLGHRVTQATLSRDIHELGLLKTPEGYKLPQGEESDLALPSIERLIQTFVYEVRTALNQVVIRTSAGSAQPVSAAIDAEDWDEVVGTIGGDDTILAVTTDSRAAEKLAQRLRKMMA